MRNRILAGLGVAALATVGVAAPATALSSTTADLWVVHAFPGATVDIVITGAADVTLEDVAPEAVAPLVDVPAGDYQVEILLASDSSSLLGPIDVTLDANTSYSAVAHPNAAGDLTLTPFVNDVSAIAAGDTRVTVRHTAEAPAVNVLANGGPLFSDVTSGIGGTADVPGGTYEIEVQVAENGATAIGPVDLTFDHGTAYFIHAYGADLALPYGVVVFEIPGLGEGPDGVPAGSAGLAAEGTAVNGALVGGLVALMLVIVAGAAVIARRATAVSGR
jgi:hypothetical protein